MDPRRAAPWDVIKLGAQGAAAWLAEFDRRGREYQAERAAQHERVAATIAAERAGVVKVVPAPVVLEAGHDVDDEMVSVPASARRVASAGRGAGWSTRVVASLAAEPTKGLVAVVTVRLRRHDERAWAAWRNGGFDTAWYVGPTGLERLSGERMSLVPRGVVSVDVMTVPQIKTLAGERGIKIPSKFNKAQVIEHVKAAGLVAQEPPPPLRGVLDVVEGIRGPAQWVDLLERQEQDRAVGVLASAFPGLCLTRQ